MFLFATNNFQITIRSCATMSKYKDFSIDMKINCAQCTDRVTMMNFGANIIIIVSSYILTFIDFITFQCLDNFSFSWRDLYNFMTRDIIFNTFEVFLYHKSTMCYFEYIVKVAIFILKRLKIWLIINCQKIKCIEISFGKIQICSDCWIVNNSVYVTCQSNSCN